MWLKCLPLVQWRSSTPCAVINAPADIQATRKWLFMIESPLTLSTDEYKEYWPFVDNFWTINSKKTLRVEYWWCRFWMTETRKWVSMYLEDAAILTQLTIGRSKVPIEVRQWSRPIGCGMKLKKKIFDTHVEIEPHGDCNQHCHSMEYADMRKKNSAVRRDGGCEVGKGYRAGQVRANLNTA